MELPKRKANRLKRYDYATPGAYFVTVCTQDRRCTLSRIPVGDGFPVPGIPAAQPTDAGRIVERCVHGLPDRYPGLRVEKYVIMPNHIHLIIRIGRCEAGAPAPALGGVMGWFKYQTTREINAQTGAAGRRFWQRSFHDHVIRDETEYRLIGQYIDDNPAKWKEDRFYVSG